MRCATLTRYQSDPARTFGFMRLPDSWGCYTLENPWRRNEPFVSCIPAGDYKLKLRQSPIVQRASGGEFDYGFEVTGVPGRTFIMLHPGNWVHDTEGCILVGAEPQMMGEHGWGIPNSRAAFRELMRRLGAGPLRLSVRWKLDEQPRHR